MSAPTFDCDVCGLLSYECVHLRDREFPVVWVVAPIFRDDKGVNYKDGLGFPIGVFTSEAEALEVLEQYKYRGAELAAFSMALGVLDASKPWAKFMSCRWSSGSELRR